MHIRRTRAAILLAFVLASGAGCGSSHSTSKATPGASSTSTSPSTVPATAPVAPRDTVDPDLVPNPIPFEVGHLIGLPGGWSVQVTAIHRPFVPAGLPVAAPGQEYVAVDVSMENDGTASRTVDSEKLFKLVDSGRRVHTVVARPRPATGLDGPYPPGDLHTGRLVFLVPTGRTLQMALDGPQIGSQRSIFLVDPPTLPPQD